ncbi:unnamed protein product [Discula destructiva]
MTGMRKPTWLAIAALGHPTIAQFTGFGGSFGGDDDNNGFGFGPGSGGAAVGLGAGFSRSGQVAAHGILASLAFVVLFPLGAIAMATLTGRRAVWVHALVQMVGWVLFVAAAALGFVIVQEARIPGSDEGWFITNPSTRYHPIIGIVLFILILVQPVLGWLHHRQFKIHERRTVVSHMHLLNGRVLIVLGIVNGGLGLQMAGAVDEVKLAYTIVAAVVGGAWGLVTVLGEVRRRRGRDVWGREAAGENKERIRMERIGEAVAVGSEDGSVQEGRPRRVA